MGYLAKKKKQEQNNWELGIILSILTFISFISLSNNDFAQIINTWRLQIYWVLILLFLYTILNRFFLYAFVSLILISVNFFIISSSANIVFKDNLGVGKNLRVMYQKHPNFIADSFDIAVKNDANIIAISEPKGEFLELNEIIPSGYNFDIQAKSDDSFIASSNPQITSGRFSLTEKNFAAHATVDFSGQPVTIISIDLKSLSPKETISALEKLENFILSCNEPVMIIGDFNQVAWSKNLSKMLDNTGLEIKNPLAYSLKTIFFPSSFYIVGYRNLSFNKIKTTPKQDNPIAPYIIDLKN